MIVHVQDRHWDQEISRGHNQITEVRLKTDGISPVSAVHEVGSVVGSAHKIQKEEGKKSWDPEEHKTMLIRDTLFLIKHCLKLLLRQVDEEPCE